MMFRKHGSENRPEGARGSSAVSVSRRRLRLMTRCALAAALLCILSPVSVAIGPIPVSLGLFGVLLAGVLLGPLQGTCAVLVFLALGLIGLPVFAGGVGGFPALAGPTGGYLWSYPLVSAAGGFLCRAAVRARNRWVGIAWTVLSLLPGVAVCYALGTLQYCLLTGVTFLQGLAVCVIPFLPFDLIKCLAASVIGILLAGRGILPLPGRSRSASR